MRRIAVIDLGTNSTRLLVADVDGRRVRELARRSEVTRLGDGVDASGRLNEAAVERVCAVVAGYRNTIDGLRAERVEAIATSAVRDSANGAEFVRCLSERFGLDARTLSGHDEARLTFLGATARRDHRPCLVIDIGGGSTELVVGAAGAQPEFHASTQLGSVRGSERYLRDDPPSAAQVSALRADVRAVIERDIPARLRGPQHDAIAVAGTATSLAAIDQRLVPYDRDAVDGYVIARAACERMLGELTALPLELRRDVIGLHPARAPTIVAGAAILAETMAALALERVETSEADLLHGVAITGTS